MKSDKRHIEQLLRRFFNGESTIAEEETLSRYFASHEVDSEWMPYKQMFAYLDNDMNEMPTIKPKRKLLWQSPWIKRVTAAATVALAIGAIWSVFAPSSNNVVTLPMADESRPVAEATAGEASSDLTLDMAAATSPKEQKSAATHRTVITTLIDDDADINRAIDSQLMTDIAINDALYAHNDELIAARQALESEMAEYNIDDITVVQTIAVP